MGTGRIFPGLRAIGSAADVLIRHAVVWIVQGMVLTALIGALTSDPVPTYAEAVGGIVLIAALNTVVQPALIQVVVRFRSWIFPLVTFLLNAAVFLLADALLPGWRINGVLQAGFLALAMTVVASLTGTLLSISDDAAWRRFALGPLRARYERSDPISEPGFAFLEIDGLAEPILREAMERGYVPHLREWIEQGTHTLSRWETDLSSQTSASQAGILLGTNRDIPAFRWYDKALGRVVVSNRPRDAAMLEGALSSDDGLLRDHGASRGNLFSGDAPDSLFTIATMLRPAPASMGAYFFLFANFYNLARTLALFLADLVREVVASTWQLVRNERPRVRRFGIYPVVRALTTSLLRELSTFTVAGDLMRGVPAIYTTYIAYDEVAHHSGIARGDTLRVLREIDRDIGRLQRVADAAPRPYHLVVLSDHGQSQGATFRQRYGRTLGQVVSSLIEGEARVLEHISADEGWQALRALISDLGHDERTSPVIGRAFSRLGDEEVALDPRASPHARPQPPETAGEGPVVLASGNLGLISFRWWERRASLEEIEREYPLLVPGLARHPGIAFLMVRSETRGPVVIGPEGLRLLADDSVEGLDPLAPFGPHVADLLRRSDSFSNAPDILVNSMVDPATGEVAAFEELVGSHGGVGGAQTMPFILHPAALTLQNGHPVGASALHEELMCWLASAEGPVDA